MIPAGSRAGDEEVSQWRRHLHWSACAHAWLATAQDGTQIYVSEETYESCLDGYLHRVSIERETWTQIMAPAEEAWQLQCALVDRFRADLDTWLSRADPGVQVWPQPIHTPNALHVGPLRWSASAHGWFGATEAVALFVPEAPYEQRLQEYLEARGFTWKTLMQIMRPAQEAWHRQCEAEHHLQSQLDFWLTADCPAVQEV